VEGCHLGSEISDATADFKQHRVVVAKYLPPVRHDRQLLGRKKTGRGNGDKFHKATLYELKSLQSTIGRGYFSPLFASRG
jgi:hypothetical protein